MVKAGAKKGVQVKRINIVETSFLPHWDMIETVRDFVKGFVNAGTGNADLAVAAALTVSELFENAIRFSSGGQIGFSMEFDPDNLAETGIAITIKNHASKDNIRVLEATMKEISRSTPRDAYLDKFKVVLDRGADDPSSHLGLARVRYEAGAVCSLTVHKDGTVVINAKIPATGHRKENL